MGHLALFVGATFACIAAATGAEPQPLQVPLNKTMVLNLDRAASVVAIANPAIADVNVQSPTVIILTGKAMGETSLNILDARKNRIGAYELVVVPDTKNHVTVNLGADAVKTMSCHPRCVRIGNPGKDPEPGKSGGGGGGSSGKGGGVLGQLQGAVGGNK